MSVFYRYRAVASWSRVQGVGIPLLTVIEIASIWVLSFFLAIPEAVGFNMVSFNYKNETIRTCMLNPQGDFMLVRVILFLSFVDRKKLLLSAFVSQCFACIKIEMCCKCWQLHLAKERQNITGRMR